MLDGLSDKYGIDVSILRIVTALSAFFTSGLTVFIYIIAAIVLPTDKEIKEYMYEIKSNSTIGNFKGTSR